MARKKGASPSVTLNITQEIIDEAIPRDSGACVFADAIKQQVPNASGVTVDLATIRWTDKTRGERYTFLTPQPVAVALFAFDREIAPSPMRVRLGRAVRVTKVTMHPKAVAQRMARMTYLEQRETAGTLTPYEKRALKVMRATPQRALTRGPQAMNYAGEVFGGHPLSSGGRRNRVTGRIEPIRQLLPSRQRVFGAHIANPSLLDELLDKARDEGARVARGEGDGT